MFLVQNGKDQVADQHPGFRAVPGKGCNCYHPPACPQTVTEKGKAYCFSQKNPSSPSPVGVDDVAFGRLGFSGKDLAGKAVCALQRSSPCTLSRSQHLSWKNPAQGWRHMVFMVLPWQQEELAAPRYMARVSGPSITRKILFQ